VARKQAEQGARTEEILRRYFLEQGFFVVRALKLKHHSVDVTDVDLWLYQRSSALMRERIIVDARDRGRPKATERILWAVGVRDMIGVDRCVVATTDRRPEVKEFAAKGEVLILDGGMLSRLQSRFSSATGRLAEEDFAVEVFPRGDEKLLRDWQKRIDESKGRLLQALSFDGCNAWLEDAGYFLAAARPGLPRCDAALRLAYLNLSFLLIGLDWIMRQTVFEDRDTRITHLEGGFRFGSKGREGFENLLRTSESLLIQCVPDMSGIAATVRNRATNQLQGLPAEGLAQFFARSEVYSKLFSMARSFEQAAFAENLSRPSEMDVPLQAVVGAVLDFFGSPRKGFLGSDNSGVASLDSILEGI
jgi:hypothetical protein